MLGTMRACFARSSVYEVMSVQRGRQCGLSHAASHLQFAARIQESQEGARWIAHVVGRRSASAVVAVVAGVVATDKVVEFRCEF